MRRNIKVLITVICVVLFGVLSSQKFIGSKSNDKLSQTQNDTLVAPKLKFVAEAPMVASWYGPRFHGKLTANGEIYDEMAFTAAHKTLPFGTLLRITNPLNQKSVIVRINDRGPYIPGRNIDLSKGTAIALGMLNSGVIKVEIERIELENMDFPIIVLN